MVEFIEGLKKAGVPYKEIAKGLKRSDRMIRYWRKPITKSLQRVGPKRKFDRKCLFHLILSIQNKKAKTQREMADYVFEKTGERFCDATISLILKKIKYTYQVIPYRHPQQKQNLIEVVEFMERANKLPPRQILATDESGHPLNLALKRGWGPKGEKIADFKPSYGTNYSLILLIRNVEKGGIIHWELVKDAVNTEVFADFLSRVELPDEETYYLLMDNIRFHHAKKIKEILANKNIEPRYIVASNPYLNPTELAFNVIKQYVRKQRPRTEEELRSAISEIVNELNQQDLRKYFKDCLDFDFIWKDVKSGN